MEVMVDLDGDMNLSFEELKATISACDEVTKQAFELQRPMGILAGAITKLHRKLVDDRQSVIQVFQRYDFDGSGALERGELTRMLRAILPVSSIAELRYLTATCLFTADSDGNATASEDCYAIVYLTCVLCCHNDIVADGKVTYDELLKAVARRHASTTAASEPSAFRASRASRAGRSSSNNSRARSVANTPSRQSVFRMRRGSQQ